jgi:hypothetical protein
VDGDGLDDLLVGAVFDTGFTGRVYLSPGQRGGLAGARSLTLTGADGPGSEFGAGLE